MAGKITIGSSNIFADLGFAYPEEMETKAILVSQINAIIKNRKLTQKKAGEILGITHFSLCSLLKTESEHKLKWEIPKISQKYFHKILHVFFHKCTKFGVLKSSGWVAIQKIKPLFEHGFSLKSNFFSINFLRKT